MKQSNNLLLNGILAFVATIVLIVWIVSLASVGNLYRHLTTTPQPTIDITRSMENE